MLYALILTLHIIVCFVLIAVILLQAGRGGGVADAFGGTAQSILGTRGAAFLTRATTICAIIFMVTSLSLAILSAQRGHSLMEHVRVQQPKPEPAKTQPTAESPSTATQPESPAPATTPSKDGTKKP